MQPQYTKIDDATVSKTEAVQKITALNMFDLEQNKTILLHQIQILNDKVASIDDDISALNNISINPK